MSNLGAILSNSLVNALKEAAGEELSIGAADDDVEYLRVVCRSRRGTETCNLREEEHRSTLRAIISPAIVTFKDIEIPVDHKFEPCSGTVYLGMRLR